MNNRQFLLSRHTRGLELRVDLDFNVQGFRAGSSLYWFRIHLQIKRPELMVTFWGFGFRAWSFRLRAECSHSILQVKKATYPCVDNILGCALRKNSW